MIRKVPSQNPTIQHCGLAMTSIIKKRNIMNRTKKAKKEDRNGVTYLTFKPKSMNVETSIPVITKGSRGGTNAWTWNGNLESPTVRPSVRTKYVNEEGKEVVAHYWLNDGVCQFLGDSTDGNANQEIELSEI